MTIGQAYYREVNATWQGDLLAVSVHIYRVVKETEHGVWVVMDYWFPDPPETAKKHFILHRSGKKFAWPTRKEARTSFIARKRKEIMLCARQHGRAVRYLALAETGKFGTDHEALHEGGLEIFPFTDIRPAV